MKTDAKFLTFLEENGYFNIRDLGGVWIANLRLLYTTSLVIGLSDFGYERRYCYEDCSMAVRACNEMVNGDDEPLPGYVANRVKQAALGKEG